MPGYILLEGGAEFGGRMAEPDRRAIELAGGPQARVSIIPAAAAPDRNHERAGANGVRWFRGLGAQHIAALPLIDRDSAEQPEVAAALRESRLIYLLGGFTHYLGRTLLGSASWRAILEAYAAGAVVAGSSAGAMVLCQHYYDPEAERVVEGLNLVPNACMLPHHDTFGKRWAPRLGELLPSSVLIGIDERTGMLDDGDGGQWRVYGQGAVTPYHSGHTLTYTSGQRFSLASVQL
jgi:cyanophycinase